MFKVYGIFAQAKPEREARALRDYVDFMRKAPTEEEAEQLEAIATKLVKRFEQASLLGCQYCIPDAEQIVTGTLLPA